MAKAATTLELPTEVFRTSAAWARWLEKNHATSPGMWLKLAKKGSGETTLSYLEAVEEALAWGWIDGLKRPFDETWWLQKFTRRGTRSLWSMINRKKAEALIASGAMRPSGMLEVERARADGRWERAYPSPSQAEVPPAFEQALAKNAKAAKAYAALNAANRYAITFRIRNAKKDETKARLVRDFVAMLARGEKLYP